MNLNGGQKLVDCVNSVQKFSDNFECVVVDNASTDGSIEKLQEFHPDVDVIRNSANYGFAKANNVGIRQAKGAYIVLLNSDTLVTKGWLHELIQCVERDSHVGLATPKLVRMDGRLDSTGHIFWFRALDAINRGGGEEDLGQYDSFTELVTCDFACAIIKREVLEQIGLLDEKIFFLHEDIDYCLRAHIAGWRVIYCPQGLIYHQRGGSTTKIQATGFKRRRQRYLLRIALKNYELRNIADSSISKLGQLVVLSLGVVAGVKNRDSRYIINKLDEAAAIVEAFLWNALHPPIKERIRIQAHRKVSDDEIKRLAPFPDRENLLSTK